MRIARSVPVVAAIVLATALVAATRDVETMTPRPEFTRDAARRATAVTIGGVVHRRLQVGPEGGSGQLRVTPIRQVAEVLKESQSQTPPAEAGSFLPADLVELTSLDPTITLDVRYATTNNFLGSVFYAEARAFLQRPAAEALVRVQRALAPLGYGLLVHDGYRPWYVTKTARHGVWPWPDRIRGVLRAGRIVSLDGEPRHGSSRQHRHRLLVRRRRPLPRTAVRGTARRRSHGHADVSRERAGGGRGQLLDAHRRLSPARL